MRVRIGPYVNWFGAYQLAELLCFWVKEVPDEYGIKSKPDWVHNFGEWLAHGSVEPDEKVGDIISWNRDRHDTLLSRFLSWIYSKRKRTVKVKIDKWDTWNMDTTLSIIILPMLKQLQATKHGSPTVEFEDVPEHMRTTETEDWDDQLTFDFYNQTDLHGWNKRGSDIHDRWNWVLDEIIWAFEQKQPDYDWEDQYYSGEHDIQWKKLETGSSEMMKGPNDTWKCDWDKLRAHQQRIDNGLRLFGKYYQGLWD
jgi:hypothetical protein